ncbi:MAG: arylamine N-acetyltransferase [bacterium]
MSKHLQTSHLDPLKHADSVAEFSSYFRLPDKKADLDYLREILDHFSTIPYENISKITKLNQNWQDQGGRVRLPEEVINGHIAKGLGGTCFSLTFFLQSILAQNGFTCYPVMADMRAGNNIHCCLIVKLDGQKYLVDPGYLLTQPMEINPIKPRHYRNEFSGVHLQFDAPAGVYNLFTFNKSESKWRYRFRDRAVPPEEFLQHWLASFGWNSMHAICLTKVMKDGLLYFRKDFMRETTFNGKRNFNVKKNSPAVIRDRFGIDEQTVEQAQAALEDNLRTEMKLGLWIPNKKRCFEPANTDE